MHKDVLAQFGSVNPLEKEWRSRLNTKTIELIHLAKNLDSPTKVKEAKSLTFDIVRDIGKGLDKGFVTHEMVSKRLEQIAKINHIIDRTMVEMAGGLYNLDDRAEFKASRNFIINTKDEMERIKNTAPERLVDIESLLNRENERVTKFLHENKLTQREANALLTRITWTKNRLTQINEFPYTSSKDFIGLTRYFAQQSKSIDQLDRMTEAMIKERESVRDKLSTNRISLDQARELFTMLNYTEQELKQLKTELHGLVDISGIRTAVARKKSKPPRMPIATIIVKQAAEYIKRKYPQIKRLHLAGGRLRHPISGSRDLDFIAVVKSENDMPGRNVTDLRFGVHKVDVFFSLPDEVETHILEMGLGFADLHWKREAIKRGYHLNRYGLWQGAKLVTQKMVVIAKLLDMELKPFLLATLRNPL